MRFEGKVAIVTGAASGIGRAVARRLASEGAQVVVGDINPEGLQETAAAIGGGACTATLDVRDPTSCDAFIAIAIAEFGRLDVLCNIAGVLDFGALSELTPERVDRTMGVNLNGVIYMTRAAMPHLLARRGVVVNMSSVAGLVGVPFNSAYCASKHAVIGFTKAVALEFANSGVRINAICPGGVNTPMIGKLSESGIDWSLVTRAGSWLEHGANCEPEDIADAVAFLASDEARRISGIAFPVDGAHTAA